MKKIIYYRLENITFVLLLLTIYPSYGSWLNLLIFYLLPDISALGFIFSKKIGEFSYNLTHTLILPTIILIFSINSHYLISLIIIWYLHIYIDRIVGWNLFPRNKNRQLN